MLNGNDAVHTKMTHSDASEMFWCVDAKDFVKWYGTCSPPSDLVPSLQDEIAKLKVFLTNPEGRSTELSLPMEGINKMELEDTIAKMLGYFDSDHADVAAKVRVENEKKPEEELTEKETEHRLREAKRRNCENAARNKGFASYRDVVIASKERLVSEEESSRKSLRGM